MPIKHHFLIVHRVGIPSAFWVKIFLFLTLELIFSFVALVVDFDGCSNKTIVHNSLVFTATFSAWITLLTGVSVKLFRPPLSFVAVWEPSLGKGRYSSVVSSPTARVPQQAQQHDVLLKAPQPVVATTSCSATRWRPASCMTSLPLLRHKPPRVGAYCGVHGTKPVPPHLVKVRYRQTRYRWAKPRHSTSLEYL